MSLDIELKSIIREYFDSLLKIGKYDYQENGIDLNIAKAISQAISTDQKRRYEYSTPLFAWMDLTSRCNFRCIHCLYNESEYSGKDELSSSETMRIIDELIDDFGIVLIVLSGGEIFLRPDLIDIVEKLKRNNVAVKLLTNAALINDKQISQLSKLLNPYTDTVQVSLDGASSEIYGKIRQTNLFDKVVDNIEKLIKANIRVDVGAVVNTINYKELSQIYQLASNLGVKRFFATRMIVFNDSHKSLELSDRDLFKIATKLYNTEVKNSTTQLSVSLFSMPELLSIPEARALLRENSKYREIFKLPFTPRYRTCNLHDRISIRSDGRVYMCMQAEACEKSLLGNCKNESLLKIWAQRQENVFFQPRMLENMPCYKCDFNDICTSGCLVESYQKFGDINIPPAKCWQL